MSDLLSPAHLFGYAAFAVSLVQYQFKNQRTLFGISIGSDALWVLHYLLLGGLTPAISVTISLLRTSFVVFLLPQHRGLIVLISYAILVALCIAFNNDGWVGYLPILAAGIFSGVSYFNQSYAISRSLMFAGLCCWIVIGIAYGSLAEVISSGFSIASLLIGVRRHKASEPSLIKAD